MLSQNQYSQIGNNKLLEDERIMKLELYNLISQKLEEKNQEQKAVRKALIQALKNFKKQIKKKSFENSIATDAALGVTGLIPFVGSIVAAGAKQVMNSLNNIEKEQYLKDVCEMLSQVMSEIVEKLGGKKIADTNFKD